jgi:hypothetical protein
MGSDGWLLVGGWRRHDSGCVGWCEGWAICRRGSEVFRCGLEMSFGCGEGFWKVFAYGVRCEARPCGKEVLFDGLCPGRDRWAKACSMQKINKSHLCFLFVGAVCVMLVGGVVGWERVRSARWCNAGKPHPISGVP